MGGCHPRQSRLTGVTAFIVDPRLDVLGDRMDHRANQRIVRCNHHLTSKGLSVVATLHHTPLEAEMLA